MTGRTNGAYGSKFTVHVRTRMLVDWLWSRKDDYETAYSLADLAKVMGLSPDDETEIRTRIGQARRHLLARGRLLALVGRGQGWKLARDEEIVAHSVAQTRGVSKKAGRAIRTLGALRDPSALGADETADLNAAASVLGLTQKLTKPSSFAAVRKITALEQHKLPDKRVLDELF